MSKESTINYLVTKQPAFVETCRSRVYSYIERQDRRFIVQIVEKNAYGPGRHRTHHPGIDSYIAVLACFCAEEKYKDHELDSVLTEPIVDIVCNCYCELINQNSEQVNKYLNQKITQNEIVLQETLKMVMGELSKRGLKFTEMHLAHLIHEAVSQAAQTAAHSQLGATVGHGILAAASTTTGQILLKLLFKAIAQHVATITSHIASNAVVTVAAKVAAKKVAIVAVTGVVVKALAAKFGIASAATALHVVGWVILGGYLSVKLIGLPEEMAKKVADGVQKTLNDKYRSSLTEILDNLAKSAQDPKKLANIVIAEFTNSDLKDLEYSIEATSVDMSDPSLPQLQKDARKDAKIAVDLVLDSLKSKKKKK
ncbi:hypothetical protein TWF694_009178 [Orbilia ellipsospora]|uniref:Uncharacterized protein n=1 Tax=Orbilia ellipsospora TaxID=2528407 RepID=A0AAV9XE71_9PEZI